MSAPDLRLKPSELNSLRLCAKILEERAKLGLTVTVSANFAKVTAGFLRRLLERGG